ncbi:MAG: YihY/virulence factor BrkB family protein, partial [bacterium]
RGVERMSKLSYCIFRVKHFVDVIFTKEIKEVKGIRKLLLKWAKILAIAIKESLKNRINLRAASLTYVTLVSIVPVFAFAFSIGKGLGFGEKLKVFLIKKVAESTSLNSDNSGSWVASALERVFNYIDKTNFETLGVIGVVMLVYLVIQLLGSIEATFNDIWYVTSQRSLKRKFTDYISVVVIFPFFVLIASASTAALASHKVIQLLLGMGSIGSMIKIAIGYSSYIFLWIAFSALYLFMPNTKVKLGSAIVSGIIGGTLWEVIQWLYFHFQIGLSKYNVIYSTMAALPAFLIWLYISWEILLFGAEISFAHQMVDKYRIIDSMKMLKRKTAELIGLSIILRIAKNFIDGKKPITIKQLSDSLGLKYDVIEPVINLLKEKEIIYEIKNHEPVFLLALSPGKLSALDVINAVSDSSDQDIDLNHIDPVAYDFCTKLTGTLQEQYHRYTIADLLNSTN